MPTADDDPTEPAEPARICFLAVDVPRDAGAAICEWVDPLLDERARPVRPDRLHVTLVYYGRVDEEALGPLTEAIAARVAGPPLHLVPGSPGRFARAHVLWLGLEGDVLRLEGLQREVLEATRGFGAATAGLGDAPAQGYLPHLTVARTRGRSGSRAPRRFLEARPVWGPKAHFVADRLVLFESVGGRYRVLAEFPLEDREGPDPARDRA